MRAISQSEIDALPFFKSRIALQRFAKLAGWNAVASAFYSGKRAAQALNVSHATMSRWQSAFEESGLAGLVPKPCGRRKGQPT